jgi:hypothetical protein
MTAKERRELGRRMIALFKKNSTHCSKEVEQAYNQGVLACVTEVVKTRTYKQRGAKEWGDKIHAYPVATHSSKNPLDVGGRNVG